MSVFFTLFQFVSELRGAFSKYNILHTHHRNSLKFLNIVKKSTQYTKHCR